MQKIFDWIIECWWKKIVEGFKSFQKHGLLKSFSDPSTLLDHSVREELSISGVKKKGKRRYILFFLIKSQPLCKNYTFSPFFLQITISNIRRPRPTYLWPRLKHFASAEALQKMGYECKILLDLTSGQEVILARRTRPSKMEVSPWSLGLSKYIVYFHLKLPLDLFNGSQ